jgi:RNA polymerase sigma-70 factor (ECF subfamily)
LVLGENFMAQAPADSAETRHLLEQVRAGDRRACDELFARHQSYLLAFVGLRLDPKLRSRVDPSDVVQEAQLEALRRLDGYLHRPAMPFRLWLRQLAFDRLLMLRRRHVTAAKRALGMEVELPDRSSLLVAEQLLAGGTTPSRRLDREELARRVRLAVARLAEMDREILLMRTFEGLTFEETACLLKIDAAAARKRHGRALLRLHKLLTEGGLTESQL